MARDLFESQPRDLLSSEPGYVPGVSVGGDPYSPANISQRMADAQQPRQTEQMRRLPELEGLLAGEDPLTATKLAGLTLMTNNQDELAKIYKSSLPHLEILTTVDNKGNTYPVIFNPKNQAVAMLNKPGPSLTDLGQFGAQAAAFTPAGRAATPLAMAGRAGLTQSAIEGAQAVSGGEVNPSEIALNAALLPAGDIAGRRLLAPAIEAVGETGKAALRGGFRETREQMQRTLDDFALAGTTPTATQASGFGNALANRMAQIPGGGPLVRKSQQLTDDIQGRLRAISQDISRTQGDEEAGLIIQRGITGRNGFVDRFQGRSAALWGPVDRALGDSVVPVNNTRRALDELISDSELAQVFNNPLIARIREHVGDTVPYEELRQLRSTIGRRLGSNDIISDVPTAELRRLYGAISQDIGESARATGVGNLWQRANRYTASGHGRIDDYLQRITNKVDPADVFNSVVKGGDSSRTINAFKRSLTPQEWEVVSANVIRKMGRATPGQQGAVGAAGAEGIDGEMFSVAKFLTDWNKLGERNKNALLSGSPQLNRYREDLDAIARTAENIKFSGIQGRNPSGTGQLVANTAAASSLATTAATGQWPAFGAILGLIGANNGGSRLMANPGFVRWLSRYPNVRDQAAYIGRLSSIAASSSIEDAADIYNFMEQLVGDVSGPTSSSSGPQGS